VNAHEGSLKVVRHVEGQQFTVIGAKSMYKATPEDTRGAYSLAIETTPPHSGLRFTDIIAKTRPCTFWRASTRSSAPTERFVQVRVDSRSCQAVSPTVPRT